MKGRRLEWKDVVDSFEPSVGKVAKKELRDACIVQRKKGEHERNLTIHFNHPWDLGILDLGPEIVYAVGVSAGPVSGTAFISSGLHAEPVKVDAQIEANVNFHAKATIQLASVAFGHGFEAGINLIPYFGATWAISESTTGVCPNNPEHHSFGVNLTPSTGVSLNAEIAKAQGQANPLAKLTIANVKVPIPNECFGFGPVVANSGKSPKRDSIEMANTTEGVTIIILEKASNARFAL
ncbi:hypothetical protein BBP40_000972 [Aspergillus hancockii]|nr:hypothetical protein BBP40_000972 [Aspergillus hancockii]